MSRRANGMTLLEVVVAMSALASLTTLVAALWSQTRDWTSENASHHRLLATERALSLLTEQWQTRALMVSLGGDSEAAVQLDATELRFVTTTPILYREAPLVSVTYRIERTGGALVGEAARWSFEYAELPVLNPASAASGSSGSLNQREKTLTLIESADELRWETWIDERGEADAASASAARLGWFAVREAIGVDAVMPTADGEEEGLDEAAARAAEKEEAPLLRAGRLVGVVNGEEFAWQFIAAHSR